MQNSLSGEILPQLKQTTYPIKSPTLSANVSEIMLAVSPNFPAAYAVLTNYLEAYIARSHANDTRLLSTDSTITSYFVVLYYRFAGFATNQHSITLSISR